MKLQIILFGLFCWKFTYVKKYICVNIAVVIRPIPSDGNYVKLSTCFFPQVCGTFG